METSEIKVSVIVPVKNGEYTIRKTLNSVLEQNFKNIECIVVHGDSSDNTKKILDNEFSSIKTIHGKDKTIADAMNKGIKISSGELISVLNSGDTYKFDTVSKAVEKFIQNPNKVLHGDMRVFFDDGKYYDEIVPEKPDLKKGMIINHPTMFIPRKLIEDFGAYDETFQISSDWELCVRYFLKGIQFEKINNEILVDYEVGGISTQKPNVIIDEAHRIRKMYKLYNFIDLKYVKGNLLLLIFRNKLTMYSHKKRLLIKKIKI